MASRQHARTRRHGRSRLGAAGFAVMWGLLVGVALVGVLFMIGEFGLPNPDLIGEDLPPLVQWTDASRGPAIAAIAAIELVGIALGAAATRFRRIREVLFYVGLVAGCALAGAFVGILIGGFMRGLRVRATIAIWAIPVGFWLGAIVA